MIHRRSIVYNIQWCGIIYVCTYTRVTHTESLVRESLIRPLDPRQGLCPCTPPGALRRAPGPHPKSARAYALAMCAPRTCLPPQKKIGSRLRARYVRSAHMFAQKKSDPSNSKKSARASRSLPPHNQSLPPSCPPTFKILVPPLLQSHIFMYKYKNKLLPASFHDFFTLNSAIHSYPTRNSPNYHLVNPRLLLAHKSIRHHGPGPRFIKKKKKVERPRQVLFSTTTSYFQRLFKICRWKSFHKKLSLQLETTKLSF